MNAPLNSKGTASETEHIKDRVRETGALSYYPERWNVNDIFCDWIIPEGLQNE